MNIRDDIRAEILEKLKRAEMEHGIRILYACESGSRVDEMFGGFVGWFFEDLESMIHTMESSEEQGMSYLGELQYPLDTLLDGFEIQRGKFARVREILLSVPETIWQGISAQQYEVNPWLYVAVALRKPGLFDEFVSSAKMYLFVEVNALVSNGTDHEKKDKNRTPWPLHRWRYLPE